MLLMADGEAALFRFAKERVELEGTFMSTSVADNAALAC